MICPRGTKDLYGINLQKIKKVENILKKISFLSNFEEIITPTFEYVETFLKNTEDLYANKEFFYLDGKKYILKPENTSSVIRFVETQKLLSTRTSPLNFYYFSKMFRYERPQKGRYREFWQFGLEKINSNSIYDDLEIILLINELIKKLNINLNLKINYLSGEEKKSKWNVELNKFFNENKNHLNEKSQSRINKNPLRIFDDKDDSKLKIMEIAPKINDFWDEKEKENVEIIKSYLNENNVKYVWDEKLVRGIDYYTGLVFEWEFNGLTVVGGGRYDELYGKLYKKIVPCVGCAIGIERLIEVMDESNYFWDLKKNNEEIYIASMLKKPDIYIMNLINFLRYKKIKIITNWSKHKLKDHFKYANAIKCDFIFIYGENEFKNKEIKFQSKEKEINITLKILEIEEIYATIKKYINN